MSTPLSDHSGPSIRSGCVRIRFQWTDDCWTHLIERLAGDSWLLLAEPIHADAGPDRVVSPTYQEVHLQPAEQGDRILAVGRWGNHHFSAVFSMNSRGNDTILAVDVADRCRKPFDGLGCAYRVGFAPGRLVDASPLLAVWDGTDCRWRIETESPDRLAVAELGRTGMSVQVQATVEPSSFTHRCRYHWVFAPNPTN
jgi:hypothetical protein